MRDFLLAILSILVSLVLVLLFVCLGWYIVWKLFLSRFKFVRELLGTASSPSLCEDEIHPGSVRGKKIRRE